MRSFALGTINSQGTLKGLFRMLFTAKTRMLLTAKTRILVTTKTRMMIKIIQFGLLMSSLSKKPSGNLVEKKVKKNSLLP
jgi:hypothetical protein